MEGLRYLVVLHHLSGNLAGRRVAVGVDVQDYVVLFDHSPPIPLVVNVSLNAFEAGELPIRLVAR